MTPHTCVNERIDVAPRRQVLRGDRKAKQEPGTHIIEFPGGAVEVSRLRNGDYWAHITVNRGQALQCLEGGFGGATGTVVDSRVDWAERHMQQIPSLPDGANLTQLAVLIRPEPPR